MDPLTLILIGATALGLGATGSEVVRQISFYRRGRFGDLQLPTQLAERLRGCGVAPGDLELMRREDLVRLGLNGFEVDDLEEALRLKNRALAGEVSHLLLSQRDEDPYR